MKRTNARRNGHNRRKASALLTSLTVLLCVAVLSTVAFLVAYGGDITNIFRPSDVSIEVEEKSFDNKVKEDVSIKNTGNTDAYIRAAIVVTWKDADGNVYAGQPVENVDYTISLNTNEWFEKDGFYYCKKAIAPDASTPFLINSCAPVAGQTPEGYGLNVEILGSGIQSVPANVVTEAWGVDVNSNATLG